MHSLVLKVVGLHLENLVANCTASDGKLGEGKFLIATIYKNAVSFKLIKPSSGITLDINVRPSLD